jgi:hypothetical protein
MTDADRDALVDEIRRRIELTDAQEAAIAAPPPPPSWASYFAGHRDALHELLEYLEER